MRSFHCRVLCFLTLSIGAASGCGGKPGPQINDSVEGIVTMDSEPLGGVIISFVPETDGFGPAPGSNATTDDRGHFKLVLDDSRSGAVVGKHRVLLSRGRPADPRHRGEKETPSGFKDTRPVPAVYKPGSAARLQVTVMADKHIGYDFSIKSTDK